MIEKIGLIAKSHKLEKTEAVAIKELYNWLEKKNIKVSIDSETAKLIEVTPSFSREEICQKALDLIIVLGGDGTLLSVARLAYDKNIPIFGVNMGNLGFLTEVPMDEISPALETILAGNAEFEERIMLNVFVIDQGNIKGKHTVLNDVVFNKGVLSRIADLKVYLNDQEVTSYRGDGLIISTPTGSTAYSLAAGGPILHPTINALIVCPICPFSFANRPVVIPDDGIIDVRLESDLKDFYVTLDGQAGFEMKTEYIVRIQRASSRLKLIRLPNKNHYEVLRKKLKWGDR